MRPAGSGPAARRGRRTREAAANRTTAAGRQETGGKEKEGHTRMRAAMLTPSEVKMRLRIT